jgi:hypothetical protein
MNLDGRELNLGAVYFVSVRVQKRHDGSIALTYGGAGEWLSKPPYSTELFEQTIREKLSLLMLAPVGTAVKGVGRRLSSGVYHVRMFPLDVRRLQPDCYREEDLC